MVLQSLFIGYCSSNFIYRSVKDMTELEKQEIIAEVEASVMAKVAKKYGRQSLTGKILIYGILLIQSI